MMQFMPLLLLPQQTKAWYDVVREIVPGNKFGERWG
jgi:hypothetical protein